MRIQVGDGRLFFDVDGAKLVPDGPTMRERPTLLLLHGGPGFDHSGYKPILSPLTDSAQLIHLDNRSNGRSDRTGPERWTLSHWGDDVRDFCDALQIEKPVVMGTSFGGFVAMAYATRYPDHPGKLILCSTSAKWRLERVLDAFERIGGKEAREVARRFFERPSAETGAEYTRVCLPCYMHNPGDPHTLARTLFNFKVTHDFMARQQARFDFLEDLKRIKCPTLVLGGEDDPIAPIADSEDIAAGLPHELVRFERFVGCGHGVMFDAPEQFLQVIRDFLKE